MAEIIPLKKPATFDDFWKVCPKKVGKALTRVKWDAITSGGLEARTLDKDSGEIVSIGLLKATPEELIAAMADYGKSQLDRTTWGLKDDGKFTLHPASWLNRGRWMDG